MFNQNELTTIHSSVDSYLDSLKLSKKTKENYRSDTNHFFLWLELRTQSIKIESFNNYLITQYLAYLEQSNTPAKTINRRLTTLRHISKCLANLGVIDSGAIIVPNNRNKTNKKRYPKIIFPSIYIVYALIFFVLSYNFITNSAPIENSTSKDLRSSQRFLSNSVSTNWIPVEVTTPRNESSDFQVTLTSSDEPPVYDTTNTVFVKSNSAPTPFLQNNALLPKGHTEVTISDKSVTPQSSILITPTSSTYNQVLYINNQDDGYFTVKIEEEQNIDIKFNWAILQ